MPSLKNIFQIILHTPTARLPFESSFELDIPPYQSTVYLYWCSIQCWGTGLCANVMHYQGISRWAGRRSLQIAQRANLKLKVTLNVTSTACGDAVRDWRLLYDTISNVFGVLLGAAVVLRLFSRYLTGCNLWYDDYTILLTMVSPFQCALRHSNFR